MKLHGFEHILIHWLDDLRHFMAFTWAIRTWVGNISAGVVMAVVGSLFWPRVRHAFERFVKRHVEDIKGHVTEHNSRVVQRLEELERSHASLHQKLDDLKESADDTGASSD